jgi:hypothetical protein
MLEHVYTNFCRVYCKVIGIKALRISSPLKYVLYSQYKKNGSKYDDKSVRIFRGGNTGLKINFYDLPPHLHGLFIFPISTTIVKVFMIKSEKCSISEKCPVGSVTNAALWSRTQRPKTTDALS